MFFRRFFWIFAVLLLIGAFFSMNGRHDYQNGYAQGYMAGQQSLQPAKGAEAGTTAVNPAPPASPDYRGFRGMGFLGGLFRAFVFFFGFMFLMALMGLLFGGRCWRRNGRKWQKWHKEWHHHGGSPPWYDQDDLKDEPVMKA